MEAIAAVPTREPIYVREIKHDGSSRIERLVQLRKALLLCLREEGCLEENGTYSVSDLAHHLPNHITVEVHASERKYQGVVTEMGEKVTMCVYQV